ncbi:MAG TPA: phosphoesterase [Firmicutes bacterium]|nr:phosphoesterase [Bacillota bacterium]
MHCAIFFAFKTLAIVVNLRMTDLDLKLGFFKGNLYRETKETQTHSFSLAKLLLFSRISCRGGLQMPDLHLHTHYSDGEYSPAEIVAAASQKGLALIAITDHDTIGGVPEAIAAGMSCGVKVISGIEFSVDLSNGKGNGKAKHLLGYSFEPEHPFIAQKAQWSRDQRVVRNQKIVERLRAHGMIITRDELLQFAKKELIGRPHFAQLMVAKGYVQDAAEAFDRYLGKGQPCYVDRERLPAEKAITAIREAGGYPVWAHPMHNETDTAKVAAEVADLKSMGLAGLEVYYPEHDPQQTAFLLELCLKHQLFATAGSDYHSDKMKGHLKIEMGRGWNNQPLPNHLELPFA